MLRTRLAPLLLAATALVCGGAFPAASEAKKKRTCKGLKGKDLAPAKDVRLVPRRNGEGGTDLLGCVLPRGKIRHLAARVDNDGHGDEGYSLKQVAGGTVLLSTSYSSQYGGSNSTSVFNIRTGKRYKLASACREILTGFCGEPSTSSPRAFVNDRGQAVAAIVSGNTVTIAGFSPRGVRANLDSGTQAEIPPPSLNLAGSTATWSHSGQQRTAQLPG